MKKKCIRFLPLLLACLLLCGCFLEPAEGLYAVPKQSEEYYDLQNAIELALPDGAVYAPPVSGDNQQVVQMVDLDGDGEDEAVVYCKTTGELPLGIYVFDRQNDAFTLAASVQGAGSAFHHVSYVAFDDQPGYELVVGRQISDRNTPNSSRPIWTRTAGRRSLCCTAAAIRRTVLPSCTAGPAVSSSVSARSRCLWLSRPSSAF